MDDRINTLHGPLETDVTFEIAVDQLRVESPQQQAALRTAHEQPRTKAAFRQ